MSPGRDYFISYTAADVAWAEWIAVTLDRAGLGVTWQKWDFRPGEHFVARMQRATSEALHTIAVLSPTYLESAFSEAEWRAAFTLDPRGEQRRLIPVRVAECSPLGLLADLIRIDLVGLNEDVARKRLLEGVAATDRMRPQSVPFPGEPHKMTGEVERGPEYPGPRADEDEIRRSSAELDAHREPVSRSWPGGSGAGAERTPWEWLHWKRPRIVALLGENAGLVGHHTVVQRLRDRLAGSDTAELVILTGPAGSGKSALIGRLEGVTGGRIVDAAHAVEGLSWPLRADGNDVGRLLRALRPVVDSTGQEVLVFDDIDHHLRQEGITRFVQDAIRQLDVGSLVLSTSTALTPQLFPVPVTEIALDRRRAQLSEFVEFLDRVLDAADASRGGFDEELRRCLYELSEQTSNFRAVHYVVEMLVAYHRWAERAVRPADLRRLLEHDVGARRLPLPAVKAPRGRRMSFRGKDKSELLADVLLRHCATRKDIVARARSGLVTFDANAFLDEAEQSYVDAVLSLCLTYSPRDLVLLLGRDEIQEEIDALHLDPGQLFADRGDKAQLLVRGLGFTLVEKPKGLADYTAAVRAAQALVDDEDARTNVINGAGTTVSQHVRAALVDLLHFWATLLFGSVRDAVKAANAHRSPDDRIDWRRLESRQIVSLLEHLAESADDGVSAYRLPTTASGSGSPLPEALLDRCRSFVSAEEAFRSVRSGASQAALRGRCADLAAAATAVLTTGDRSFPAVIKLSEIVFDEYSRKIFRGLDSDDNEIRFAITADDDREELVVAAHYFMLPRKRVSVNPHIVPRSGAPAPVLFDRAEAYDRSSSTQTGQAVELLARVDLRPEDRVVDVGCGTGTLAVQIGRRVRSVLGIDNSPAMIRQSEAAAHDAGLANVTFELADLLEFDAGRAFDLVISNATMHWILPPERAYSRLFSLLRPGGRLAVHQGGHGNYEGLHSFTRSLIAAMELGEYFQGWTYPMYYPTVEQYRELLEGLGFIDVAIDSEQSDGSQYPHLLRDFSEAGLLPYLARLPEVVREPFRAEWLEDAVDEVSNRYTHRLYATAVRP